MTSPRMARLRANLATKDFAYLPKAEQRRRTNKVLNILAEGTTDPKLEAAVAKRQKADRRREAVRKFGDTNPRNAGAMHSPEGARRRFVYGSADMSANDYYTLISGMKSAAKQERHQAGFPDALRHPTTVDLCILPLDANLTHETNAIRPRLRASLDGLSDDARTDGAAQVEIKYAEDLAERFPEGEWPAGFDPISEPKRLWALLHVHLVICDPWMTKNEIRRHLKKAYPGRNRVNIRRVRPVIKVDEMTETQGAQGFLEYARIARCRGEMQTPRDTADALIAFIRLETTWSGKSKGFKYGNTLAETGVSIDPAHVKFIETQDRAQYLKDNWDKLEYAERFIHLWFSGMVAISLTDESFDGAKGRGPSFIRFLFRILTNWVTARSAKDRDFSWYLRSRLRE